MRRRQKGEKRGELCIQADSCIITGIPLHASCQKRVGGGGGGINVLALNQKNERRKTFQEINGIWMVSMITILVSCTILSKCQPHCVLWMI